VRYIVVIRTSTLFYFKHNSYLAKLFISC